MGSLAGHVLPGCLFLVWGVWWAFLAAWTHLNRSSSTPKLSKPKLKRNSSVSSVASFFEYKRDHDLCRKSWLPQPFCTRFPLEPTIKIILPLLGVIAETFFNVVPDEDGQQHLTGSVYRLYDKDGDFTDLGKLHHITMYSSVILSGIMDFIAIFIKLPKHTSQIFLSLAFWVEGMLFYFHTAGDDPLSVQVHGILTTIIFMCGIVTCIRLLQPTNLLINVGIAYGMLLQATWFIQAGCLLFPTHGKEWPWMKDKQNSLSEHKARMYVAACITWHVLGTAVFILLMWVVVHIVLRSGWRRRRVTRRRGPHQNWVDSEEQRSLITTETAEPLKDPKNVAVELQEVEETAT